jgi:hypothetical protein
MNASNSDDLHELPADHPTRLLMIAHRRLSSRPAASNGMKSIVVAAYGDHVVRLIAFVPGMITHAVSPLWVELQDSCSDCTLDGAGCKDLSEAIAAAEEFLAEAKILNTR